MDSTIFTTDKAARVLGIPEWRVVRFAQIKKYGITPAYAEAEGPGTRRLYNLENICEMALAFWLTQAGLRIEVIGRVMKGIRRRGGLSHLLSLDRSKAEAEYLGVIRTPRGKIVGQESVEIKSWEHLNNIFRQDIDTSLVIIPIGRRFLALADRLKQEQKGD
jgi:hypothetical protein